MNRWSKSLLVALRIAIGWHFLYEGVYKIDSDRGTAQYAAARYPLQAATGRLRNDLARGLTPREVSTRVDAWNDEIVKVFKGRQPLSEDQKAKLTDLGDKVKLAAVEGTELVPFDWTLVHEEVLKLAAEQEGERFTSLPFLQGSAGPFRTLFRGLVPDMDGLERLTEQSVKRRMDDRYTEILDHFADSGRPFSDDQRKRLAAARDTVKLAAVETVNAPWFQERLADYRLMRQRVPKTDLHAPFTRERLDADRQKLDVAAGELLSYVNEPLSELAVQTQAIATVDQLGAGPLPRPPDGAAWVDRAIKISLTTIGILLMLGLFTPAAAIAAAGQLAIFYLASPPWPGLPAMSVAGHYLFVDRNLIEAFAALVIATTATGQWAGLDFYLTRWFRTVKTHQPEAVMATRSLS
ncbi:hypothetical protein [uncultured Paludibaculum sp.]|uniref:hypothetical protein n=1 Tax=uncultured Paludibaculum sp. TaxID=1765020 RepID=UPI002AAB0CE0|nr:hypothetical protein [uncultured Paludibaculum sp.]